MTTDPKPDLLPTPFDACPDENALSAFAQGQGTLALETHLDGCDVCRRAVAAAAAEKTLPTVAATSWQLTPGQRVGRYEIAGELGRGGMGVVYTARDLTLDRHVALKLLHARRDEAAQARLLREAQVMAKLAHPNVVPVFELASWHDDLYLVMELVSGVTLEAWLKAAKHSRREILASFIQAGRGLAAAHAAGVVHRDFKPANVLVGVDGRVRVTDFGLSRPGPALDLPPLASPLVTREGTLVGTVVYMSPEQLDGKPATEASDQFSFCVSLAEALSGQRPFEGDSWSTLAVSHAQKPRLASAIPARVRSVLRRGLAIDPRRRFTSMTTLLNALERAQVVGWPAAIGTGVAAMAACALIVGLQPDGSLRHRLARATAPAESASTASLLAEADYVPVLNAASDLPEGTIITFDMIMQRQMPKQYVTTSIVKPEAALYIVGQKLLSPVQRGDALLWSNFATAQPPIPELAHVSPILRFLIEHDDELGRCATTRAHEHREEVTVTFDVGRDGQTDAVRLSPTKYETEDERACLVSTVKGWRFPPTEAGSRGVWTQVTFAPSASPAQASETPSDQGPSGVFGVFAANKGRLARCVEFARTRHPSERGNAVVELQLDATGEPQDVKVTGDASAELASCLVATVSRWHFAPPGPDNQPIHFPLKF